MLFSSGKIYTNICAFEYMQIKNSIYIHTHTHTHTHTRARARARAHVQMYISELIVWNLNQSSVLIEVFSKITSIEIII